jgi:hypothetical protein
MDKFMDAIVHHDVDLVDDYLKAGANPNYNNEEPYRGGNVNDVGYVGIEHQPTTPLKMVVFRISDCMLKEPDWEEFLQITKLLLAAGADPEPAILLSEHRYGEYDYDDTFGEILRTIRNF